MPGTAFHVYARTIGRAAWFNDEVRDAIVGIVADALHRTDARLLAFVVMPNHFHLVVQQGHDPLSRLMQPICRRTALAVHRIRKRAGRVFERRFYAKVCSDAGHVRAAIAYVHLNPVKRLCKSASDYAWSSQWCYAGENPLVGSRCLKYPEVNPAISLFADVADPATHRPAYGAYMNWFQLRGSREMNEPRPRKPRTQHGDIYWATNYSRMTRRRDPKPDLRDIVLRVLHEVAPGLSLDELRVRRGGRTIVEVRRIVIERGLMAGHRGVDIAAFLNVSPATVSRVGGIVWSRAKAG